MKKFNTILELSLAIEKANGQLNLQILLNRRTNFGNGWEDFTMEGNKHKGRIKYILNNVPLQHWGFQRIIFNGKRWQYVAGQDYTNELKQIRNFIKK